MKKLISWSDFEKIDIRTGTIMQVEKFPEAKNPAYKLKIDFGELGVLWSSAQIVEEYFPDELIDKQIIAIVNFPKKQIANFFSECLVLGIYNTDKHVILLSSGKRTKNGLKVG